MIDNLTKRFRIWVVAWFASSIAMVYTTSIVPLWAAITTIYIISFILTMTYAIRLTNEIWKDGNNK